MHVFSVEGGIQDVILGIHLLKKHNTYLTYIYIFYE